MVEPLVTFPGGWELVLILAVVVLLFGARKLPELTRSVAQSLNIFKEETKGLREDEGKGPGDSGSGSGSGQGSASTGSADQHPREIPPSQAGDTRPGPQVRAEQVDREGNGA